MTSIRNFELAEMINKLKLYRNRVKKNDLKCQYEIVIKILSYLIKEINA